VELKILDSGLFGGAFGEADREVSLGTEERWPSVDEANALSAHAEFQRCDRGRLQGHVVSAAMYQKSSIG
jgi:hypothetical protein